MALDYIVAASNEMFLGLAGEMTTEPSTLAHVAAIGCNTLRRLVIDQDFQTAVIAGSVRRDQYAAQFDDITGRLNGSLKHLGYFLNVEREVMLDAGFDTRLVDQLTVEARQLVTRIRAWEGEVQTLLGVVAQIRDQACQLAAALADAQQQTIHRAETLRQVRRFAYAVAGGAVIVLNAAVPFPLSVAGATVSIAFGSALIGASLPPA